MNTLPNIFLIVSAVSILLGVIFKGSNIEFGVVNAANFLQLTHVCLSFAIGLYLMQIRDKIKS